MNKSTNYTPSRVRVHLSQGDAVRVMREMGGMTQTELAEASGVSQPTISAIEGGRVALGVHRAERLAAVFHVDPAVLIWPNARAGDLRRKRA